jgi:hypothetical protein
LKGLQEIGASFANNPGTVADAAPRNISAADFRLLQSRLLSNALAFAEKDTSIQNNMSVVLLIEWGKRRLLFVGDAEWDGEYKEGKQNGSWNVMWEKRNAHLSKPVDFLKIGHHGSINATPPVADGGATGSSKKKTRDQQSVLHILDAILPLPSRGKSPTAQAIVSTEREFYPTIPDCKLLAHLAERVRGARKYGEALKSKKIEPETLWVTAKAKKHKFFDSFEKEFLDVPQPLRTDLEHAVTGNSYIDVEIDP